MSEWVHGYRSTAVPVRYHPCSNVHAVNLWLCTCHTVHPVLSACADADLWQMCLGYACGSGLHSASSAGAPW